MKYLISAILLAMSLAPLAAQADTISPGEHFVKYCVTVENASSFADYSFFLENGAAFPATDQVGTTKKCGFDGSGSLIAVKSSDLSKIVKLPGSDEQAGAWPVQGANVQLVYTGTGPTLDMPRSISDTNPVFETDYILHVDAFSSKSFSYHVATIQELGKNGQVISETHPTATQNAIAAPEASTVTSPLTLMWLVIVCMGAVILALVVKTWKK